MAITQTITTLPAAPDPASMTRDQFNDAAAAYVIAQKAMVPELNTWAGQVNAISATSVGDVATAIGAAGADTPVDADKFTFRKAADGLLKSVTLAGLKGVFAALAGSVTQDFATKILTAAGNVAFSGTGNRITGDFSNATAANRVLVQSSTVNGSTIFSLLPNGTGGASRFYAYSVVDATNANVLDMSVDAVVGHCMIASTKTGAGSYLPMQFYTGGSKSLNLATTGEFTVTRAAGLGYGTGAGGTVTQTTSKSTSATLNNPTGQITMNNAALGAGSSVQFQCVNSLSTAADLCAIQSSVPLSYSVKASCASGSIYIVVKNETGGSLSDALVLNFAIMKGATA